LIVKGAGKPECRAMSRDPVACACGLISRQVLELGTRP
jgi:hypothetical protein